MDLAPSSISSNATIARVNSLEQFIDLWLKGKSPNSQRAYRKDIQYFLVFLGDKPLEQMMLNDVHDYLAAMEAQGWAESTINRRLAVVKSLLTFGNSIGLLRVNVGKAVRLKEMPRNFSQRTLTESQVLMMIAMTPDQRDRTLLRFMYAVGCRVSELCSLRWQNITENPDGTATVHIFGKGRKNRWVKFSCETWKELQNLRGAAKPEDHIFASRQGGGLKPNQVRNIVKEAGLRVNAPETSPHWLRHSHAGHSVQRKVPLTLLQETLGHESLNTTRNYIAANPSDSSAMHLSV
ncbi:MAG: tyrosine-type recombinase/integrase [Oscillatoriales cyanobacterium C42_A2020_001]|nr:tyrosine-type recombinase/integrase [Leptolyngbyaceae cyanobacterium C42_A2020_001]